MCVIDELSKEVLSTENILKYIDDYSIYSYYIGEELELNARYSSPLREGDDNPSFCLFKGSKDNRIYFKDHATVYKGDIFQFVRILMGDGNPEIIPFEHVLKRIDKDFNLGLYLENGIASKLPLKKAIVIPTKEKYSIRVSSFKEPTKVYLDYWDKYDISLETHKLYNTTNVSVIHYSSTYNNRKFQIYPKTLCIAYQIGGRYELYFPFETKKKKFQNDLPTNWIGGFLQLKYKNDFCIITKAMKEVSFFRGHFDWDAVKGKSETTMIPNHLMKQLFDKYKRVYIWLDSDETGIKAQQKYLEKYTKLIPIQYPSYVTQKDVTDRYAYMKSIGMSKIALEEIRNLILNS
jgi:hypothetical protein